MLHVGIINPDWTVQRHNTDHVCVMDFSRMNAHTDDLRLAFIGNQRQYLLANLNRVSGRLSGRWVFPQISVRPPDGLFQALYRYGHTVLGLQVRGPSCPPLLSTVGYPSLRQDLAQGEPHLHAQADALERDTQDSTLLHFHTDAMRALYLDRKPAESSRCVTIPFYLPHMRFIEIAALNEKFLQDEVQLLFVGADGERKGLQDLCEALDLLASDPLLQKLSAVIVSKTAPSCKRFQKIRHEVSLPRETIQTLMQQSHIYCMVPHRESFGLVFVEAMAAGCAVIADDDIPRQEILDRGNSGVLLPARRADLMAQAIRGLLAEPDRMRDLAKAARHRAAERYAPQSVAQSYASAFRQMTCQSRQA